MRSDRARSPKTTIEILTPDFLRKDGAVEMVMSAPPDVYNHNLETVPRLYLSVRPGARYFAAAVAGAGEANRSHAFTKSRLMVGLGERAKRSCSDGRFAGSAHVDFLTIGQYLQPSRKHAAVARFWEPDEFKALEQIARAKGFLMVSASPLTRSSYHAGEDFAQLRAARLAARS